MVGEIIVMPLENCSDGDRLTGGEDGRGKVG